MRNIHRSVSFKYRYMQRRRKTDLLLSSSSSSDNNKGTFGWKTLTFQIGLIVFGGGKSFRKQQQQRRPIFFSFRRVSSHQVSSGFPETFATIFQGSSMAVTWSKRKLNWIEWVRSYVPKSHFGKLFFLVRIYMRRETPSYGFSRVIKSFHANGHT